MASNLIAPISSDNIKVSYVNSDNVIVSDVSVSDANDYEKRYPGTTYIFIDGDNRIRYLNIDEVNNLQPSDLVSNTVLCSTEPSPCGPPRLVFSGGDGIGAEANAVIDSNGSLIAIDIINPGVGYQSAPRVEVVDDCNTGSGAVVEVTINENGQIDSGIVLDPGANYIQYQPETISPPATLEQLILQIDSPNVQEAIRQVIPTNRPSSRQELLQLVQQNRPEIIRKILERVNPNLPTTQYQTVQSPVYPVFLGLKDIVVTNPGINYDPNNDVIEITPNNGTILQGIFNPFGQLVNVKIVKPGLGFISRPDITIRSKTGVNADFTPVFEIIRDPQVISPQIPFANIVSVVDTVGLTVNGYVNGKPYYGNVYFENGLKYAGPFKTFEDQIRVYDTLQESVLNSR